MFLLLYEQSEQMEAKHNRYIGYLCSSIVQYLDMQLMSLLNLGLLCCGFHVSSLKFYARQYVIVSRLSNES